VKQFWDRACHEPDCSSDIDCPTKRVHFQWKDNCWVAPEERLTSFEKSAPGSEAKQGMLLARVKGNDRRRE